MQNDLISIIVPVYNAEDYLESCVQSIVSQTYTNLEIILINDGSTDGSPALCNALAEKDSRIVVIHKENGGGAGARNAGLDIATGKFVAFVDNDDTIEKRMYELLHGRLKEIEADMCICGFTVFADGYKREVRAPDFTKLSPNAFWNAYLDDNKYFQLFFMLWNKLFRMELFQSEKIRAPENHAVGVDSWLVTDYICAASEERSIVFLDIPMYNYMAKNNPNSGGASCISEKMIVYYDHLKSVMISKLPHKTAEIIKVIDCQMSVNLASDAHKNAINNTTSPRGLPLSNLISILRSTSRTDDKFSAFLVFLLPSGLYRLIFSLYKKNKNNKPQRLRNEVCSNE